MAISNWVKRTVAESERRRAQTPVGWATDDQGGPAVPFRWGRALRKLPRETRQAAANRQLNNARNDLWEASHLDLTATILDIESRAVRPGEGPVGKAAAVGFAAVTGGVADTFQVVWRTLTAGVRGTAALYHKALG
ncbi:MAG: hypothetical protein ACOZIN_01660 [Myxococcota bacterium]